MALQYNTKRYCRMNTVCLHMYTLYKSTLILGLYNNMLFCCLLDECYVVIYCFRLLYLDIEISWNVDVMCVCPFVVLYNVETLVTTP